MHWYARDFLSLNGSLNYMFNMFSAMRARALKRKAEKAANKL